MTVSFTFVVEGETYSSAHHFEPLIENHPYGTAWVDDDGDPWGARMQTLLTDLETEVIRLASGGAER